MENLNISREEDEDLIFDVNEGENHTEVFDLCLVGRLLTDQTYNFNIMKNRMAAIWKPNKGVLFKSIGDGRMLIQFFHKLDLKRVVEG